MSYDGGRSEPGGEYVLGHHESELARLERQGSLFAGPTRDLLARAGIAPGMRVFDVGCGVGDVSMIVADLVGPDGAVHGLDPAEEALSVARERMAAAGKHWVTFSQGRLEDAADLGAYDAVVGRFILLHLADPAGALKALAGRMMPGARVAFVEFDLTTVATLPRLPLLEQCVEWIREVYRRSNRHPDMGASLFGTYRAAGLTPALTAITRITDGKDPAEFDFLAESVKSLLPAMQALGIANDGDVGVVTLRDRLIAEAQGGESCIFYPRLVGAWAQV